MLECLGCLYVLDVACGASVGVIEKLNLMCLLHSMTILVITIFVCVATLGHFVIIKTVDCWFA